MIPLSFVNRPYQDEALDAIWAAFSERSLYRQAIVLPTGCGKTIVFAGLRKRLDGWFCGFPKHQRKVMVVAHREELLDQAAHQFASVDPSLRVEIEQADRRASPLADVVIASVPTLAARSGKRMAKFPTDQFRLLVIDEFHHSIADTYRRVIENFGFLPTHGWRESSFHRRPESPEEALQMQRERLAAWDAQHPKDRLLVGVTATIQRGDGVGLEAIAQEVVYHKSIRDMVEAGFLCNLRGFRVYSTMSLDRVGIRAGDFALGELGNAIDTAGRNLLAVKAYQEYAPGRKAVVFCALVAHAAHMAQTFREAGISAAVLHGQTDSDVRRRILQEFRVGTLRVLTNVGVLTEGWDEPSLDCVIHARPTKSQLLYAQMTGRGTRIFPGKADCIVIDITDVSRRHRLCALPELVGLPADFDLAGRDILGTVQAVEAAIEGSPPLGVDTVKSLNRLQTAAEEFDLLAAGPGDSAEGLARLAWQMDGRVYWLRSNIRKGFRRCAYVEIHPDEERWAVYVRTAQGRRYHCGHAASLREAFVAGERRSLKGGWARADRPEHHRISADVSSVKASKIASARKREKDKAKYGWVVEVGSVGPTTVTVDPDIYTKTWATLAWQKDGDVYWLGYERNGVVFYLELRPKDGQWSAHLACPGKPSARLLVTQNLAEGFARAEEWFRSRCPDLYEMNEMKQPWRSYPIASAQIAQLAQLAQRNIPGSMTRGQASNLLAAILRQQAIAKHGCSTLP